MTRYRAILLGGVCLGLLAPQALAQEAAKDTPAWAAEATMNPDYRPAEDSAQSASDEAAEAPAPAAPGEAEAPKEVPPWAAEATMNPDYKPLDDTAAAAEDEAAKKTAEEEAAKKAAEEEAARKAAEEEAAKKAAEAEAARKAAEEEAARKVAEEEAAKKAAEEEAARKAAEEEAAKKAAEAEAARKAAEEEAAKKAAEAEAARKAAEEEAAKKAAEAEAARKAAEEAEAKRKADEEAARQAAIETCRDALNGAISAGNVQFAFNSWSINAKNDGALDKVAAIAKDCPANTTIEVGGHTDSSGSAEANQKLSELRAKAVVDYLVKAGIDSSKLKAAGYGQDKPVADNKTAAGRAKNRRIEFSVSSN